MKNIEGENSKEEVFQFSEGIPGILSNHYLTAANGDASFDLINNGMTYRPKFVNDWEKINDRVYCDKKNPWRQASNFSYSDEPHRVNVEYVCNIDGHRMIHRVAGPARYAYNINKRCIEDIEFWYLDELLSAYDYYNIFLQPMLDWEHVFDYERKDGVGMSYDGTTTNWIITFRTSNRLPCPYKMYGSNRRMVWRLGKTKVTMAQYFTVMEQIFAGFDRKRHIAPRHKLNKLEHPLAFH